MNNELALNDVMTLGQALAKSGYFTDAKEANQAVVKVLAGQELGIGPIAAMSALYIVKGKVTLSANVMASLIKSSKKYDYKIVAHSDKACEIEFFEHGQSLGVSEFTIEDAKMAGLMGGDNWKKYPRNMLFARAMSNGAKWFCPDLFNGQSVYTPEELEDKPRGEPDFIIEPAHPQPDKVENDTARQEWIKSIVAQPEFPSDSSPMKKVSYINAIFDEKEINFEPVTVAEIMTLAVSQRLAVDNS